MAACRGEEEEKGEPTLKFYRSFLPSVLFVSRAFLDIEIKSAAASGLGSFSAFPRGGQIVNASLLRREVCSSFGRERQQRNERHERAAVAVGRVAVGRKNGPQIARNVSAAFPQKLPLFPSLSLSPSPSQVAFKTSQIEGNAAQIMMVFIAPVLRRWSETLSSLLSRVGNLP